VAVYGTGVRGFKAEEVSVKQCHVLIYVQVKIHEM
jgi:hypothetical protein